MPTTQRTRTIAASPQELWEVIGDPHHLPRWWPRVSRVEAVEDGAFTEVLVGSSGKVVRADFKLLQSARPRRIAWAQQLENTPFERVLKSAETEIGLEEAPGGDGSSTSVTIELRQELQGFRGSGGLSLRLSGISRFGSPLVRRAAIATVEEALAGLEQIAGRTA